MVTSETLNFENARAAQSLYVKDSQNLRKLEEQFGVKITTREGWIKVDGLPEAIAKTRDVFQQLHLAREQEARGVLGVAAHGLRALVAVRDARGVAEVQDRLAREPRTPSISTQYQL